jgi:hypothetical protein
MAPASRRGHVIAAAGFASTYTPMTYSCFRPGNGCLLNILSLFLGLFEMRHGTGLPFSCRDGNNADDTATPELLIFPN